MSYTKQQWELKQQGLCIECGARVDRPSTYVRCPDCRTRFTEYMKERRALKEALAEPESSPQYKRKQAELAAQKAIKAEKYKLQIKKCSSCGWKRIEGNIIFCPFMEGICERGHYV